MSRVIPLPLKRVAERQQILPTCLLSFSQPFVSWEVLLLTSSSSRRKIIHLFQFGSEMDFFPLPAFHHMADMDGAVVRRWCSKSAKLFSIHIHMNMVYFGQNHKQLGRSRYVLCDCCSPTYVCALLTMIDTSFFLLFLLCGPGFCSLSIDLWEESGQYTWGLEGAWKMTSVHEKEISNRTKGQTNCVQIKTLITSHYLFF